MLNYEAVPVDEQWDRDAYHAFMEWGQEMGMDAREHPLDGFHFVISGQEQTGVNRIWLQYFQPLVCGYGEDYLQELDAANERLYEAGFDRYLEAVQEQLAECGGRDTEEVPAAGQD